MRHPALIAFLWAIALATPATPKGIELDLREYKLMLRTERFAGDDGSDEPPAPGRNGERHFHNEKRSNEYARFDDGPRSQGSIAKAAVRPPSSATSGML